MKTLNLKSLMMFILGTLLMATIACDKKSESNPAPVAPVQTYAYVNGICYETTTNTPAAANFCTNSTGAYRWNGIQCVDVNNQPVATNLCSTTNGNYRWNGSSCVDLNGQLVSQQLCANMGATQQYQIYNGSCYNNQGMLMPYTLCTGSTGFAPNQCNGLFIKYYSWGYRTVNCYGNSCSGRTLIEYYSGREVVCP